MCLSSLVSLRSLNVQITNLHQTSSLMLFNSTQLDFGMFGEYRAP